MTIDPLTISIVSDVIANGVTTVFSHAYRQMTADEKTGLRKRLESSISLGEIIQKSTAAAAKDLKLGKTFGSKLRTFLVSPEVESIIRQIYSFHLAKENYVIDSARAELTAALAFNLGIEQVNAEELGSDIFAMLLAGVEGALSFAAERGSLGAHEALSSRRLHIIKDEIRAVRQNLEFLTKHQKANFTEIQAFEEKLRAQVIARHSHIVPPHFDSLRKVPIDDLYVSPDLLTEPTQQGRESDSTALDSFLETMYRAVLLGDPGGGKSTLAQKVTHDLARYYSRRLLGGRLVTPMLVVLREYGAYKKEAKCSLLEYLGITARSLYQLNPPEGSIEYLLLNGRMAVIFDGLDELLDTSYRQEVSLDIELFCTLYTAVPALITSRKVGYEQAPLDPSRFIAAHLAPFNKERVQEYARKWFLVQSDLPKDQRAKKVSAFINESDVVPDLRSNPLMLALMCNIYRGEDYIPQNRPEVYEKCATMLFERWDKSRGITVPLPFEAHIRPAMMYLAFWIYSHSELQGGVTETALIDKAAEYLARWRFDDIEEARMAANSFIEFCRGRAWVFTDVGTTKDGDRIYQFTHRTFLEYFTGAHLARINETAESLGEALRAKITQREWDVVAQLAFQIKAKASEGATDKLLGSLVEFGKEDKSTAGWSALSFAARCLEFLVPSPLVKKALTEACLDAAIRWGLRHRKATLSTLLEEEQSPRDLLRDLLSCSIENRRLVGKFLEEALLRTIDQGTERESYLCLEAGLNLTLTLSHSQKKASDENFLDELSRRIYTASKNRIFTLQSRYMLLSTHLLLSGDMTIKDVIETHGTEMLFRDFPFALFPHSRRYGHAKLVLNMLTHPSFEDKSKQATRELESLGHILTLKNTPWFKKSAGNDDLLGAFFDGFRHMWASRKISLRSNAWFGLFALLGGVVELLPKPKLEKFIADAEPEGTMHLLKARRASAGTMTGDYTNLFAELDLTRAQELLVQDWIGGKVNFVDKPKVRKPKTDTLGQNSLD